jgi:hypothetical protein
MIRVVNRVVFNIRRTPDGYDVYRLFDGRHLELIEEGVATMDDVERILNEEA